MSDEEACDALRDEAQSIYLAAQLVYRCCMQMEQGNDTLEAFMKMLNAYRYLEARYVEIHQLYVLEKSL